ncbi:MAG: hypothetical protein F2660_01040 [Actinobacteria bacterium]|uniref:Unannotated protein n=1 Tax=freshwater metagenome TaxID=449393 RepID=A0A6J6N0K1_9ZZZZ|nr:hypothetical protein [Actinomycetota bacterium]
MIKRLTSLFGIIFVLAVAAVFVSPVTIQVGRVVNSPQLTVQARDLNLICPGAAINSGGTSGTSVGSFSRIGAANVFGTVAAGAETFEQRYLADGYYDSYSAETFNTISQDGTVFATRGDSGEQGSTMINVGQVQKAVSPRLNGLLAASCQAPSPEIWLLGGSSATGRETLLLLANPSLVDITVSLEVFSEGGPVQASGLSGISISAGTQTVVPLSSLIPETRTFAIHVSSSSGAVAAWLQQRTVRGLLYSGVDFVSPATVFAESMVIPGILIRGAADAAELKASNPDYSDLTPVLRVFNSGESTATFTAQIIGATEKTFGTVIQDSVSAKTVQDFEIPALANGDYSAFLNADQKITASIRLVRTDKTKSPNTDFTWLQAAETFVGSRQLTVPSTGISKLTVVNANEEPAKVTVNGVARVIAASSMLVIRVDNAKILTIVAEDRPVAANLVVDVDGMIGNYSLVNYKNLGGQVSVRVR